MYTHAQTHVQNAQTPLTVTLTSRAGVLDFCNRDLGAECILQLLPQPVGIRRVASIATGRGNSMCTNKTLSQYLQMRITVPALFTPNTARTRGSERQTRTSTGLRRPWVR